MKKLAIMAILVASVTAASALEIGTQVSRFGGTQTNAAGITAGGLTLSETYKGVGVQAGWERGTIGLNEVSRYSLTGSLPVAKMLGATLAGTAGVAYIDPSVGKTGYTMAVGAGFTYPVTPKMCLAADYSYQLGQSRVSGFNGNAVSVGAKYKF